MPDSQTPSSADAVRQSAHAFDSRSCITWSLSCIRKLQPDSTPSEQAAIQAAAKWLSDPSDENRRASKTAAEQASLATPAGCVSMAVFFAEGSIAPPEQKSVPPPAGLVQEMGAAAILLAIVSEPAQAAERYDLCLQLAREIKPKPAA